MRTPDLASYRVAVEGPLAFVRDQCVLADGLRVGDALADDPWIERDLLRPVFDRGADGLPLNRLVYLELGRGHWKSGGAGAISLVEAILEPSTDVVIAAADTDQANIVGENIDGFPCRTSMRPASRSKSPRLAPPHRSISSDVPTSRLRGVLAACLICAAVAGRRRRSPPDLARIGDRQTPDAQTIVLSNAGFDAGRGWQWRVRETAAQQPWGYLFAPEGVIASWITAEWIAQMRSLLPAVAFERVILNRWTNAAGDFVSAEQWARCVDRDMEPRNEGRGAFVAALDLGLVRDRTVLAIGHRDHDRLMLDNLQAWQGSRSEPVSIATIERAILDAARRFAAST